MENTTQEIIYQLIAVVMSGVIVYVGAYAKELFKTKVVIAKYDFDNDRVERIIDNGVTYAEQYAKSMAKKTAESIASSHKLDVARKYINGVDKSIVTSYGEQLDRMIERKVAQKFGV